MKNVGQAIKEFRKKNGLTQTAFGKSVGVNKQTVSKWENGQLEPSTSKMFEIAQVIGLPIENFIGDSDSEKEADVFVFAHKQKYEIGLNYLYKCAHDFESLCYFVDAFSAAYKLTTTDEDLVGTILLNAHFEDENAGEEAIPVLAVDCDFDSISIDLPGYVFEIYEEMVSYVECVGSFNNEVYAFNVYLTDKDSSFVQLFLGF